MANENQGHRANRSETNQEYDSWRRAYDDAMSKGTRQYADVLASQAAAAPCRGGRRLRRYVLLISRSRFPKGRR